MYARRIRNCAAYVRNGIAPDVAIPAPKLDPWAPALDKQRMVTSFASEYLTTHAKVDRSFEPDAQILGLFRDYLIRNRIHVAEEYWSKNQGYLKLGIKAGLLTLIFGLSAGDEVTTRGDPQVQKAAGLFPEIPSVLKPPTARTEGRWSGQPGGQPLSQGRDGGRPEFPQRLFGQASAPFCEGVPLAGR
jgi:hypothetical protein